MPVPLGQAFTYAVPAELVHEVSRGARVLIEFGRRKVLGIVLDVAEREPDVPLDKLKSLVAVVEQRPVLPLELLEFLQELARYYVAPIGEVMQLAVPAVERSQAKLLAHTGGARVIGRLLQVAKATGAEPSAALRGSAKPILEHLQQTGSTSLTELEEKWPSARAAVKRLVASGVVEIEEREAPRDAFFSAAVARDTPPELTAAQDAAVKAVCGQLSVNERAAFLLDGVTASGKTEVYLRAVQHTVACGKAAIVLVPEIALTPQLVARFRARLGDSIAVLHSGLSDTERHSMWRALRDGELRVAVGARSALFAPVEKLGLLCVDEEHDGSFKQEEGVRYNARDMALLRAHRAGAVCVLGSATPAISTLALVTQGRLQHLRLPSRARQSAVLPEVEVVDLRRQGAGPSGEPLISIRLHRELSATLEAKNQAILFLNRRGFSPSLVCDVCGKTLECPHCAVSLTLHRARGERLRCHYCDYECRRPAACPACAGTPWIEEGAGTERIEQLLAESFPSARVARLDRDVASGAGGEKILERMRSGEIDILVGTQMVTKGHDLPRVTLVGVLNADAALSFPDYRAAERSFHLFVQVAGRAGRGDHPGRVLIQTRQPSHPAIVCAVRHDVSTFVEQELRLREELGYPPFSRLALLRCDAVEEARAEQAAKQLVVVARNAAGRAVQILGPSPAPIARLRGRFRFHVLLKAQERNDLRKALLALARAEVDRHVRKVIDVDPVSML